MVELEIDGKKVEVAEGSMIIQAAHKVDTYIPHFCYHKKLSIAANCRMCLVDVEKMPKAVPACATPVSAGMIVRTKSERAANASCRIWPSVTASRRRDIAKRSASCSTRTSAR